MTSRFLNLVFSPSVKAAQQRSGSREAYAKRDGASEPDELTVNEAQFIAARDSLYMASVGAGGWPYVQHRGGPVGFIKVLDERRIGFADFRGNRQYVSLGNLADDNRVALLLMDYPRRARLKILGRARIVSLVDVPELAAALVDEAYGAKVERGLIFEIEAFDWNCSQHITPRFTLAEIEPSVVALKSRVAELEAEVARLKSGS
jgi:predicted pyridoxine 5'-phosphate oxidase superfamily flavin-nucleotide-binding protein